MRRAASLLAQKSYTLVNADITIIAEEPKMAPHIVAMRDNLAADLSIAADAVNIKATTNEKMGSIGNPGGHSRTCRCADRVRKHSPR